MGVIDFRAAAGTGGGVNSGRFQRKTTLDDRGDRAIVQQAIRRAKEGDKEALRFLYVRYADNVYGYVSPASCATNTRPKTSPSRCSRSSSPSCAKYEQREVPFSAWILRVARNVASTTCAPAGHCRREEDPRPTKRAQ